MEAALLIIVGASLAHLSTVVTAWRRRRLDRTEARAERLRNFRIEQLVALQAALFALEAAAGHAWAGGRDGQGSADAPLVAATAQVRQVVVLIDDLAIRDATCTMLETTPVVLPEAIDAINAAIGDQVRRLAAE